MRPHPLLRAVACAFWRELLVIQFLEIVSHLLSLVSPLLMKDVLVFQEHQSADNLTQAETRRGFRAVTSLIAIGIFLIFFNSQLRLFNARTKLRISAALRGVVMLRCVQKGGGSGEGASTPAVYNVVSFDVGPNIEIIWIILGLWLFPLQFSSTLVVLYAQVERAVVPGLAVILVAKAFCMTLLVCDGFLRDRLLCAKDVRLRRCDEGFNGIRTLQMLNWVEPFERRILEARNEELRVTKMRLWMTKMVAALDYSLGTIVTLATLWYYVRHTESELKASVALTVVALVSTLIGPFGQFPVWAQQYLIWRSAYKRVNDFMGLRAPRGKVCLPDVVEDEARNISATWRAAVEDLEGGGVGVGGGGGVAEGIDSVGDLAAGAGSPLGGSDSKPVASFEGCTLGWGAPVGYCSDDGDDAEAAQASQPLLAAEAFTLQELDLEARGRELLVLVGQEGQGKSSVLQALLGEMHVRAGRLRSPAVERRLEEASEGAAMRVVPESVAEARLAALSATHADAASWGGGGSGGETESAFSRAAGVAATSPPSVPFASQSATLFTGTLRWNIVFGSRFDADLYKEVLNACALLQDLTTMPAGDLTDIAQGGATLSGGQRQRIGLARAAYCGALEARDDAKRRQRQPGGASPRPPLVLLDDPFCALDRRVAEEVCTALFGQPSGLLSSCAVVVVTADPWWIGCLPRVGEAASLRLAVMRSGRIVASGSESDLSDMEVPELGALGHAPTSACSNPQDDDGASADSHTDERGQGTSPGGALASGPSPAASDIKTELQLGAEHSFSPAKHKGERLRDLSVVKAEEREDGQVKCSTYAAYFSAVGPVTLTLLCFGITAIMVFQNLCALTIAYWTADDKKATFIYHLAQMFTSVPPERPSTLLFMYGVFVLCFTTSNFVSHILEIVGGMSAAHSIFRDAMVGTLSKPWRWWDANPTGRVLNRFSEDVEVMDAAITNIMGVIFGALLYFLGHSVILALSNPLSLTLLPFIAFGLEYYARFYRQTIREVQRLWLVAMGGVYQEMTEAIIGKVTVNAFDSVRSIFCKTMVGLDNAQRLSFTKESLDLWLGLRLALVGYSLNIFATSYPILQFYGYLAPQSAALVGFSITYSTQTVAIIQQFITNYSQLEMQLISIERLREYGVRLLPPHEALATHQAPSIREETRQGLRLVDVAVNYREGLRPALACVNLSFAAGEVAAIVGRTGAGKSSLLLAIMQLVPHAGAIIVDGEHLARLPPQEVRRRLVGVVPQQPIIFAGDVRWNLDPHDEFEDAALWTALEAVGLRSLYSSHRQGLRAAIIRGGDAGASTDSDADGEPCADASTNVLTLSQGQQQLLCAARAVLRQPRVALLDEVTASLPSEVADATAARLVARFRQLRATVLLVTHQERLLAACDRVVTVSAGRVVRDEFLIAQVD